MGRTVLPFSQVLAERQKELNKFRRALRAEDQAALDALFEQARLHIQAAVYYSNPDPAEAFFLSVLIENWKMIDSIQARMTELEGEIKALKAGNGESAA
jgi:uncharacterized coiled-coil protein SlyX